ncbi:MAG: nitroreductase family protein [Methanobacterium sp.]|jgi:hypothetical protein|uniref:nitroreductase family protein n=1 Tax=Methanobacterium sp. TaxID=2164 RepID=UPI003D8DAB2E
MVDLYPQMFKRKSIRDYYLEPLEEDMLQRIREQIYKLEPLYGDIGVDLKIMSHDKVNPRMMKKAPYYLAAFSEDRDGHQTNIGFMLQQMDLFFSANGLGSCWQGFPQPKKQFLENSDKKFVIFIAFGKPKVQLHRTSTFEFNRKPLSKITDIKNEDLMEILEAARLAPSAINTQPWYFKGDNQIIHAYCSQPNILKALVLNKYVKIDMGIVLCHIKLAAEHLGKTVHFVSDDVGREKTPRRYEYVTSVKID